MAAPNDREVRVLRRNLQDGDLAAAAAALAAICDSAAPPYRIRFGPDTRKSYRGSSIDHATHEIFLATEDEFGNRKPPAAIVVSLAHEVGHLSDPPTVGDQALDPTSVDVGRRKLEREAAAWAWAASFLAASPAWPKLEVAFDAAREHALARYRAAMEEP